MLFELKTWIDGRVRYAGEHATVRKAVEAAVKAGAYLTGADLRGADLRGADLTGADLRGAYLTGADLRGAYLMGADLTGAYLRGADLTGAYLRGAYLTGADLRGADLRGAYLTGADLSKIHLAYQSHDLLAEILRRAAGDDTEKLKIAGYVLVCRDKCWEAFAKLAAVDPLGDWALDELAKWVQPDGDAPEVLRKRAEKRAAEVV